MASAATSRRQHRVERQVCGHEGEARGVREQGALAEDGDDHRVGDHAGQNRGDQSVGFETVPVEHLDRQQRGPERRTKHRRDARRHAGHQQDAPLARADRQQARDHRPERATDEHGRTLSPARAAGAEGGNGGEGLDAEQSRRQARALVKRADHHIAPAAHRVRRPAREPATGQTAEGGEHDQHPGPERVRHRRGGKGLAAGAQDRIAGQLLEKEALGVLQHAEKRRPREPTHHADRRRLQQGAPDETQIERSGIRKQRGEDRAVAFDPPCPEIPEALTHPCRIP